MIIRAPLCGANNKNSLGIWYWAFSWRRILLSSFPSSWLQTFNHLSEMLPNMAPVLCYIQFGKFKWAIKANLTPFELNKRGKIVRLLLLRLNMTSALFGLILPFCILPFYISSFLPIYNPTTPTPNKSFEQNNLMFCQIQISCHSLESKKVSSSN